MRMLERSTRRLAVYPQSRGLAFVVLHGSRELIEWGRYSIRIDKGRQTLSVLRRLIDRFQPNTLVIEDREDPDLHRCKRVRSLLRRIAAEAAKRKLEVFPVTRAQLSYAFRGRNVSSKDDRAVLLAHLFPVLMRRLPPRRELWMSENENMAVFDAMALAMVAVGLPSEPLPGPIDKYRRLLT